LRIEAAAPAPEVVVQPVARDQAGPDAARDRLQLVVADQRTNLVL
jgi:septum formation topological specificity factor MinE